MNTAAQHNESRQLSARAIERKFKELAWNNGLLVNACQWNLSQAAHRRSLHQMDVSVQGISFKIYFTDSELQSYSNAAGQAGTNQRIDLLLNDLRNGQIMPAPLSTLSYRHPSMPH